MLETLNNTIDPVLVWSIGLGLFALTVLVLAIIENRRLDKERQKRAHS